MVEFARFAQCQALQDKGWTQDEECKRLQIADESCGGPTYMRAPDGKLYGVSCGVETPLSGLYARWSMEIPESFTQQREMEEEFPGLAVRSVIYTDGKITGHQG